MGGHVSYGLLGRNCYHCKDSFDISEKGYSLRKRSLIGNIFDKFKDWMFPSRADYSYICKACTRNKKIESITK